MAGLVREASSFSQGFSLGFSLSFALGAISALAAERLWQRISRDSGKEGIQLIIRGVGAALSAGREVTRRASRFIEDVEDMVAEAQAELDSAQASARSASAPRGTGAA